MAAETDTIGQLKNRVGQTANRAAHNPWVERIARFGYVVRGVLYGVIGLLALELALGHGGQATDKSGAISTIGAQPYGKALLVLVVVGLVGYSLWGFIRAFLDPLNRGTDPKGLAVRAGYVVSGLTYGALVIPTWRYIAGTGSGAQGGSGASADLTAKLLTLPWGQWLVGLLGVIGMIGGLGQIYQGIKTDFKKDFMSEEMSPSELTFATRAGQIGMAARGIVFAMIGFFVVQAALHVDPKQVKGVDGALQTLARQPYGPWLMGAVALGLVAFGIYSIVCARWIRVFKS